jgi:hypothetical protein
MIDFARMILHVLPRVFPSAAQPHLLLPTADPISYPVGKGPPEKNSPLCSDVLKKTCEKFSIKSSVTWTHKHFSKLFQGKWGTCHMGLLLVMKFALMKVILKLILPGA